MARDRSTIEQRATPLMAAGRGIVAGLAATVLLSVLARILPGMGGPSGNRAGDRPPPPHDPFDPQQVRAWQERSQSPAAFQSMGETGESSHPASPAGALQQPQAPGPEGLAEQFAFKLASGMFDTDISAHLKASGMAVHLTYGSAWGMLYGLYQSTFRQPPILLGALYGLWVWAVGPGVLVPAMKLMGTPFEEPPLRTAMLVAGHVAYGLTVAEVFERLGRER